MFFYVVQLRTVLVVTPCAGDRCERRLQHLVRRSHPAEAYRPACGNGLHCADEAYQRSDPETGAELNIRPLPHAAPETTLRQNRSGRGVFVRPYVQRTAKKRLCNRSFGNQDLNQVHHAFTPNRLWFGQEKCICPLMTGLLVQSNSAGDLCMSRCPRRESSLYYSRMEKLFLAFGQTIAPIHTG